MNPRCRRSERAVNSRPFVSLKLLGPPSLQDSDGSPLGGQAAQRHRIALLALLARSPERGLLREKLMGYLWPESDAERARNLLNVSLYVLRRALGEDALVSSADHLRLNPERVRSDVVELEAALAAGEHERAVAAYGGPFLDGFFLTHAPEFDQWAALERDRLAGSYAAALEALADAAGARRDLTAAAGWWKTRAAQDPYDSRVARRLMQALDAAGNPAAALQHAAIHKRLLRDEFGVGPDPETEAAVAAIRRRRDSPGPPADERAAADPGPFPDTPEGVGTPADAAPTDPGEPAPPMEVLGMEAVGTEPVPDAPAAPSAGHPRDLPRDARIPVRLLRWGGAAAAAVLALWLVATQVLSPDERAGAATDGGPETAGGVRGDAPGGSPGVGRTAPARSVAVLPFLNLGPDPGDEYFSDGLSEELIGALARIGALRVAARTSSFAFKGKTGDIRQIGEALNVATVLEGSVRRQGDRLVVTAQLIDARDGYHIWSESYERRLTEVFDIQRDLALRIASALEAELTPGERARLAERPTQDLEAYASYLRGRHSWNQRTPASYDRAVEHFQRAIAADPEFAAAHAGLAAVHLLQGMAGAVEAQAARGLARTAALRAVELDAGSAEAHSVLGLYLHAYEWNVEAAEREFRESIRLDPNSVLAHAWYGNLLSALGRNDQAIEEKRRAVDLDPLVPALHETLAFTLVRAGRLDEAAQQVENAIELDPTYWRAHAVAGLIHEHRGRPDDAIRAYEHANELAGARYHRTKADIARVLARAGRREEARRLVAELRSDPEAERIHDTGLATALLALGETDAAFGWLEEALRQRHPHLANIGGDARFAGFDGDRRFEELLVRVGMRR